MRLQYGFQEISNLSKYLGIPLLGRALKRKDFQYLINKGNNKLSSQKVHQFSLVGRITLTRAILHMPPIYPLCLPLSLVLGGVAMSNLGEMNKARLRNMD
ncbi:hypothetical protein CR513_34925, partial [Mucuna pruriens]